MTEPLKTKKRCREEKKIVEIVESSVQLQEGDYKIKMSFKKENVTMPNNVCIAKQCIHGLRLQKDLSFHNDYTNSLADVISKSYAEQVPQHQVEPHERCMVRYGIQCTSPWRVPSKEGNIMSCF